MTDEFGNDIKSVNKSYKELKTIFSKFGDILKEYFDREKDYGISVKTGSGNEIEINYVDKKFIVEFYICKKSDLTILGNIVFLLRGEGSREEITKISELYFDSRGNYFEKPSSKPFAENLVQENEPVILLKYWLGNFLRGDALIPSVAKIAIFGSR